MQGSRQTQWNRQWGVWLAGIVALLLPLLVAADPQPGSPVFYQQLIDLNTRAHRALQTRTVVLVTDADGHARLLSDDDPRLTFNLLWLEQHRDGYRYREGGAALGKLFRAIARQAWENYRGDGGASFLTIVPDGEERLVRGYRPGTHYDLRVSDDEIELGFEYRW